MFHDCSANVPRARPRYAGGRLEKTTRHRRLAGCGPRPWRHHRSAPRQFVELSLELVSSAVDGEEELAEELTVSLLPQG